MTARPIATSFLGMDARMTSQLNVALCQAAICVIAVLGLFLVFVQPGTGRRPLRPVQEFNACNVAVGIDL